MLKYLFTATLKDGSIYQQTDMDTSVSDPIRSAYYDIKDKPIEMFRLEINPMYTVSPRHFETYAVNLCDGSFEVNGIKFNIHDGHQPVATNLRLIYFRRNLINFDQSLEEIDHQVSYHIGWQCTVDGKNYQRIIEVC
jgi:hypothetical protein